MNSQPGALSAPDACLTRRSLLVALMLACLLGCICRGRAAEPAADQATAPQKPGSCVAPIFTHGAGKGILDLEGTATPFFLSETEAWEVIYDEARSDGIIFSPDSRLLTVPGTRDGKLATRGTAVALDGTDVSRKISFAYISHDDANAGRRKLSPRGEIEEIDILGYASSLRDRMAEVNPEGVCVVFYDPTITFSDVLPLLTESEYYTVDLEDQARLLAAKELRRQVRDFLDWTRQNFE